MLPFCVRLVKTPHLCYLTGSFARCLLLNIFPTHLFLFCFVFPRKKNLKCSFENVLNGLLHMGSLARWQKWRDHPLNQAQWKQLKAMTQSILNDNGVQISEESIERIFYPRAGTGDSTCTRCSNIKYSRLVMKLVRAISYIVGDHRQLVMRQQRTAAGA